MTNKVHTHAVIERKINTSLIERQLETLARNGYILVDSGLTQDQLQRARDTIDEVYSIQAQDVGGEERLAQINDKDIARATPVYSSLMREIATLPVIMDIAKKYLRQAFVLSTQNGIINRPTDKHYQCTWHRDLNYQHYTSSRPFALSVLLAVDPFSETTGGTYILPGSHLFEEFPSDEYVLENEQVITCDPGTLLIFDPMMYHRVGLNTSLEIRRSVNHIITAAFLNQNYDFKRMFDDRGVTISDEAQRNYFFGYGSTSSITNWREAKIEKLAR